MPVHPQGQAQPYHSARELSAPSKGELEDSGYARQYHS